MAWYFRWFCCMGCGLTSRRLLRCPSPPPLSPAALCCDATCLRGSLHQAIAKGLFKTNSKWNNKIALRAMLRTAREIAQGMSHLHMCRVVHGDLKPGVWAWSGHRRGPARGGGRGRGEWGPVRGSGRLLSLTGKGCFTWVRPCSEACTAAPLSRCTTAPSRCQPPSGASNGPPRVPMTPLPLRMRQGVPPGPTHTDSWQPSVTELHLRPLTLTAAPLLRHLLRCTHRTQGTCC